MLINKLELDRLKKTRCFLLDMDGTFYLGNRLLPGAADFLEFLRLQGISYLFLTNNSSGSRHGYANKIRRMGVEVSDADIFTSGEAAAIFIHARQPGARIYVAGTPALEEEFRSKGFFLVEEDPDFIVLGFDTTLTYSKLWHLCNLVRKGIPYIATHPDFNCPTEEGYMPDIGAMIAFIHASTGRQPDVIIGKPNAPIIDAVVTKTALPIESLTMVGDRLYTDIALGMTGIQTVLVLSGETRLEDVPDSIFQPDWIVQNLAELYNLLRY